MSIERRKQTIADIEEFEVDAFVVTSLVNVRYLSGFTGSNAALLVSPGEVRLFTDPRYTIRASEEADCAVQIATGSLLDAVSKLIRKRRWKRIAIEQQRISYASVLELQHKLGPGVELKAIGPIVEKRRWVKQPAELDHIRASVKTNSRAFDKAVARLKASMSEGDLAAELEYQMRRLGAEKPAFETIVASGPRSALPHASPTTEKLGTDRLLLVDMGAVQGGYCSDMTRMLHLGKPGGKARKLFKAVLEAQLAALDSVKQGVSAGSVDRKARNVLSAQGYGDYFVHSTGHGLGLEIHESPRLGRHDKTILQEGMVVTIEPGAYIEGFGGVRIEDTVVVGRNGCEILTPTPKDLKVL
jgi:Xaa-Pro aminopeptidase